MAVAVQDSRLVSVVPIFSFPSPAPYRKTRGTGLAYIQESQSSVKQSALKWLARHSKAASAAYMVTLSGLISVRSIHSSRDSILAALTYSRK